MKTTLLLLFAFTLTTVGVQAQHANIGIKGGLNTYTINGDNSAGNDLKLGYHVGLLSHFHMGNQFALQPEIYYSQQGTTLKSSNTELNLNYINIPVLFQYMFDNGFRLQAGPQLGILASAKTSGGAEVKNDYKNTDIGLTFGVSYVKPSTGFGFDIRYNNGLTNINENNVNNYNVGWQVGLFFLFQHKG